MSDGGHAKFNDWTKSPTMSAFVRMHDSIIRDQARDFNSKLDAVRAMCRGEIVRLSQEVAQLRSVLVEMGKMEKRPSIDTGTPDILKAKGCT